MHYIKSIIRYWFGGSKLIFCLMLIIGIYGAVYLYFIDITPYHATAVAHIIIFSVSIIFLFNFIDIITNKRRKQKHIVYIITPLIASLLLVMFLFIDGSKPISKNTYIIYENNYGLSRDTQKDRNMSNFKYFSIEITDWYKYKTSKS